MLRVFLYIIVLNLILKEFSCVDFLESFRKKPRNKMFTEICSVCKEMCIVCTEMCIVCTEMCLVCTEMCIICSIN